MLTTKFNNPRTYTSSQVVPRLSPLPSGPNAFTKENREAALRERGLLPPRQNKDLSAQEKELDRAIPVVLQKDDDQRGSTEADSPSAADLIKREWEAKNRLLESHQLQRMNSFKFGGNFSCPEAPVIQLSLSESADSAAQLSQAQQVREPIPSPRADLAFPHLPPSSLEAVLPPVPISQPGSRPATPLLDILPEIAAYLFPLPPSPESVPSPNFELSSSPPSPTSVPLPRSPSLRGEFDTTSLRSSLSGALTPCPLNKGTTLTPTPSTPIIALTPCAVIYSDDTTSSPPHKRSDSVPDESVSSCQLPSLDDNSRTTTDSILGTSESASISGKGRLGGLNVKTHEGSCLNIPVIVDSPIEHGFLEEQYLVVKPTSTADANQAVVPPMSAPINGSERKFTRNTPRMNKRGGSDPTNGALIRKTSMILTNPFKRNLSFAGHGDQSTTTSSGELPQRRLSVKTSLSNLRRSVVGSLSLKMSSHDRGAGVGRTNDTLRSPTSLGSMMEEEEGEVRKAVSPILYSRGHILMEASRIKDEESRRVTEMAFLT